ncbi:MAG: PEGA domain-containing protein [Myxococcales bacterium]|nr:PEGA domain-containing protein [Myxococcales bacterium]MCB9545476.1 PEGA domain-containing protein [Myxococcales bacterium]
MRRSSPGRAFAGLLALALAGAPTLASAQADPPPAAKAAYDAGVAHFQAGRYPEAIAEFNKAYRMGPNPILVFNMARAFEELGDFASATEFYKRYLQMAPEAPDRKVVEESLRTLELLAARQEKPAEGTLEVQSVPEGATVLVDGRPVGRTPLQLPVASGRHFVAVEHAGHSRESREIAVDAGKVQRLDFTLVSVKAPPPPVAQESNAPAWILLGVGTTMIVGGSIAGVIALDRNDQLDAIESGEKQASRSRFDDLQTEGRTWAYAADGLMIGGAASALAGGLMLLLGGDDAPATARSAAGLAGGWR